MRQIAKGKLIIPRQTTPDAHDGAQDSPPDVSIIPMTARTHVSSPVVLPLVSESNKLLWVDPHQINLKQDGVAELNKAFDRFPYLTDRQTAELAQRCSLHPDQVKVWFMAQRLLYGISWDYSDILEVLSKLKFNQADAEVTKEFHKKMKEGFNEDRGNRKQEKVQECGGEKTVEEQSTKEKETTEQNGTANKQLESDAKQEQLMEQEESRKVEEDKINTVKKRKRVAVMGKRKKRKGHDNEGIVERAAKVEVITRAHREQKCTKSVEAPCTKKKKRAKKRLHFIQDNLPHKSPFMLDIPLDISSLFIVKPQSQTDTIPPNDSQTDLLDRADGPHNASNIPKIPINSSFEGKRELDSSLGEDPQTGLVVTDGDKLKELTKVDNSLLVADYTPTLTQPQDNALPHRSGFNTKTEIQLEMLRMAFMNCQYPNKEYYRHLEVVTGISRQALVQWFGDTRYHIKKSQPRWMSTEQHRQALAAVKYQQCMKTLAKEHQTTNDDCTTKMLKFEGSRSFEEGESVKE